MKSVTSENFNEEVKQSSVPVIVDFLATWCGPCRQLKPILTDLSGQSDGKFKIVSVDVDECQDLAVEYNIASIPTILVFKEGQPVNRMVGVQSKETLLKAVGG